jgi:hypothetical protein
MGTPEAIQSSLRYQSKDKSDSTTKHCSCIAMESLRFIGWGNLSGPCMLEHPTCNDIKPLKLLHP